MARRPAQFVDSAESLRQFVQDLCHRIHNEEFSSLGIALYIDLEGINLCRHGRISLLTILIRQRKLVTDDNWETHTHTTESIYILDIKTLGAATFSTATSERTKEDVDGSGRFPYPETVTLKEVLESPDIPKVFFDVRNDSDALFAHFKIHLRGTMDLQLLENFKRHHCHENTRFVHNLAKCVREDLRMNSEEKRAWEDTKEKGRRLFAPERGGQYAVFDERPLNRDLITYCVQDVLHMPDLWKVYCQMLRGRGVANWRRTIKTATKMRVKDAESASYIPNSWAKVLAPSWATVVYDPDDSDEDYDPPSPPETGREFEGIEDSD